MPAPIATDTPDNQRGLFNPQALLAEVSTGAANVTVGVPTNAETVWVSATGFPSVPTARCQGVQTGIEYAGTRVAPQLNVTANPIWVFDVSSAVDQDVTITFSVAPAPSWYVYADAAPRIVADITKFANQQGLQYVIPSAPNTNVGDHPLNELQYGGAYLAGTNDVIGAPGPGLRFRIFVAHMAAQTAGVVGGLRNGPAGQWFATVGASGDSHMSFPVSGLPLPANQSINYQLVAGAGNMLITCAYTIENV